MTVVVYNILNSLNKIQISQYIWTLVHKTLHGISQVNICVKEFNWNPDRSADIAFYMGVKKLYIEQSRVTKTWRRACSLGGRLDRETWLKNKLISQEADERKLPKAKQEDAERNYERMSKTQKTERKPDINIRFGRGIRHGETHLCELNHQEASE